MSYFEELNNVNVSDKTEKKSGLTYLSWSWAWGEFKKRYPYSFYTVYENQNGWNYFTDGNTAWVKTGVTIVLEDRQIEHIEYLPIMDYKNKSIPLANVTSMDVNKAIQRSLTKAVARHGLGLYVYSGEDLPEEEANQPKPELASEEVKKTFQETCKLMNQDPVKIIKQAGWVKGEITKDQIDKAKIILSEISEANK